MKPKQSIPKHLRLTIEDFLSRFPDDEACLEYLKEKRYPKGMAHCAKCNQERKHHRVTGRPAYACDYCGSMISPMAGTIFEHSSTSLESGSMRCTLWVRPAVASPQSRFNEKVGVTYKTAWRMFKQIRSLLSEPDMQLEGSTVEMDETYVGGKRRQAGAGVRVLSDNDRRLRSSVLWSAAKANRLGRVTTATRRSATRDNLPDHRKRARDSQSPPCIHRRLSDSYDGIS